jgi:cell cycle sensor histidine kinase DivJ
LLSNALKFTPPGGSIFVSIDATETGAQLTVRDTGCGIAADLLPGLFQPFVQTDNTFERAKGGTGLGLALVRSLARLHGGDARIESVLGAGTTVTVVFPGAQSGVQIAA